MLPNKYVLITDAKDKQEDFDIIHEKLCDLYSSLPENGEIAKLLHNHIYPYGETKYKYGHYIDEFTTDFPSLIENNLPNILRLQTKYQSFIDNFKDKEKLFELLSSFDFREELIDLWEEC